MKMADRIKEAVKRFQQISLSSLFVILVSVIVMITSVVSLLIFVNLSRNDMEQNAITTSEQAVVQVKNTVFNYTEDMSDIMQMICANIQKEEEEANNFFSNLLKIRSDVVAVTSYDMNGKILKCWTNGQKLKENYIKNLSYVRDLPQEEGILNITKPHVESLFVDYYPWVVTISQNMQDAAQFTEMVSNTTLYSRYALFTCVAEEGGSSTSLEKAGLADKTDSEQAMGTGADAAKAYEASGKIADSMLTYGLNLNFAPVADLATVQDSYLKDASYGSDAALAASFVTSAVQGMQEKGISSCLKYFPGAADMKEDPAKGMASSERTAEQLAAEEFTVFKAGIDAGADMVMVGHVAVPALTGDNTPCSLSSAVITDKLRNELSFNGVIITDAMNKGAITEYYEADEAAILALKAGCDMILCPDDFEKAYNGVLEAVQNGTISEERINDSLRRIYRIKYAGMMPEA